MNSSTVNDTCVGENHGAFECPINNVFETKSQIVSQKDALKGALKSANGCKIWPIKMWSDGCTF